MGKKKGKPTRVIALRVEPDFARLIESLCVRLTVNRNRRCTLSDVMREAILLLARKEKVQ